MTRVQAVALDLFEARGFDGVAIEEIARAAEVGPATIYRNFGSKERVVLWDEYDPMLLTALAQALVEEEVLTAVQTALSGSLAHVYRDDRERVLRRARLIRRTPALQTAATADQVALQAGLAAVILASGRAADELTARVFAGAITAAIVAGIDRWLDEDGGLPLGRCFRMALDRLRRITSA